jgi:hypothetical protein
MFSAIRAGAPFSGTSCSLGLSVSAGSLRRLRFRQHHRLAHRRRRHLDGRLGRETLLPAFIHLAGPVDKLLVKLFLEPRIHGGSLLGFDRHDCLLQRVGRAPSAFSVATG